MTLKDEYVKVIQQVATGLADLNERVVYVGGAVVGLYANSPAADDVRATLDIDISLQIATLSELEQLRLALAERGFVQSHEDKVICRFRYKDILVDVMSTSQIGWAPGSRWFELGFDKAVLLDTGKQMIKILPLPYFLAAKIEAYTDRATDARTSKDFEDIVYLFDNVTDIVEQVTKSEIAAREYIVSFCQELLNDNRREKEGIYAHLNPAFQQERYENIMNLVEQLAKLT